MTKIISNRGTSSFLASVNSANWCGDSFKEVLKLKKEKMKSSQMISINRGTNTILAKKIPENFSPKKKGIICTARGTSTRSL